MLRFLITDIVFSLVFAVVMGFYLSYLENRKHIPKEVSQRISDEAKSKMMDALSGILPYPKLPLMLAIPAAVLALILTPLWEGWYVFNVVRAMDKYDPEEEGA